MSKNPDLHDKIEFDIAITYFTFDLKSKLRELPKDLFSNLECEQIFCAYREHLCSILEKEHIGSVETSVQKLSQLQKEIAQIKSGRNYSLSKLIDVCKEHGTRPFAVLARHAFIGTSLIRSLENEGILTKQRINDFFSSITTI